MTTPIENISDPRYVRALSHPLRVRILAILEERTASPLELAHMLRADLGVVAYHVRTLRSLGLLTLERETKVRGATQRHYRAIERPRISDEAWAQAPPIAKQAAVDAAVQQIADYARGSNAAGGFDRPDAHLTRTALRLDRSGWDRLSRALRAVLEAVAEIEEELRRRSAAGEKLELADVGLVIMLFEARPFSAAFSAEERASAPAECVARDEAD